MILHSSAASVGQPPRFRRGLAAASFRCARVVATPRPVIAQINAAIVQALTGADVRQRFGSQGFEVISSKPKVLGNLLVSEQEKYARVIRESGMKIE